MKKSLKDQMSADNVCAALRSAADEYLGSRKRDAVYKMLERIYRIYRKIRRSEFQESLAVDIASSAPKRRKTAKLSHLLFYVASADFDRRDVFKWAQLIERAFSENTKPSDFIAAVKKKKEIAAASSEKKQSEEPFGGAPSNTKALDIVAANATPPSTPSMRKEPFGSPYYRSNVFPPRPGVATSGTRTTWKNNHR